MAQIHVLICVVTIILGIIGTRGLVSAGINCTCRNNNNDTGVGDLGVTNFYLNGYGGGTCYFNYYPPGSVYNNSFFFNNTGGSGTGFFIQGGDHDGHNGLGNYTYYHLISVFTGITNFNYFLSYVFDSGTISHTCSGYCGGKLNDCHPCCIRCCGGREVPTHPFASDGRYNVVLAGD